MRILAKVFSLQSSRTRRTVAAIALSALVCGVFTQSRVSFADNAKASKARKLTEEQRIVHVLNRLGFGARPGDV
jgi:hypothetical protein